MTYFDKLLMQGLSKYYLKNYDDFKRFFQKKFKNIFPKVVTNVGKKQASVAHVILFALVNTMLIRQ
jgi:hypothetical protein